VSTKERKMQRAHTAIMHIRVRHDGEDAPPVSNFIEALEKELRWWKEHGEQKHMSGAHGYLDWGPTFIRDDDDDYWMKE